MRALSKLEMVHGGLTVLAFVVAAVAVGGGILESPAKALVVLVGVLALSVLSWIALGWLLPGARRPDSHWRAPLSNAAGKRIMGIAVRAPFYLLAVAFAVVIVLGYMRARY